MFRDEALSTSSLGARVLRAIPDAALKPLKRIIPTLIYRIEHARP